MDFSYDKHQTLERMRDTSDRISPATEEQSASISVAVEQMALGSQQIVSSVKRIDELSKKASGEAQTVSAATEEQSASMEETASSSQALANLAMNLREEVGKFQI